MSYRVIWGLGRSEDFATATEASTRADEIHAQMVEAWPILDGTNDGALPRVVEVDELDDPDAGEDDCNCFHEEGK